MAKYDPQQIETKWQSYWDSNKTFKTGIFHSDFSFNWCNNGYDL